MVEKTINVYALVLARSQFKFSFYILQLQTFDLAKEEMFLSFFLCKLLYWAMADQVPHFI